MLKWKEKKSVLRSALRYTTAGKSVMFYKIDYIEWLRLVTTAEVTKISFVYLLIKD